MTKKKRNHPDVEEVLSRPWCYYCERDFDDLKILINHQKAKHFKCERCGRRLNTAGGLSVHMSQVHKENLSAVDNALPNRAGLDIEIFGMEGIPEDIINQHTQRVLQNYHQAEAERRAASGNSTVGGTAGAQPKKPKFESPSELKKRLAEHKAKLAEQQANGGNSGGGTPVSASAGQAHSPMQVQNHAIASPQFGQYQQPYNGAPASLPYSQPPKYAQPPVSTIPFQQQPQSYPPQPTFSPPPYQTPPQYNPTQSFPPPIVQNGPPHFPAVQNGQPRTFGSRSPVQSFQPQFQQPQRTHTPPQNGSLGQRSNSGSLPTAPGLPQRPAFGAPQVNAFQFQQMHQGQIPSSQAPPGLPPFPQQGMPPRVVQQQTYAPPPGIALSQDSINASSVDDLISDASKRVDAITPTPVTPVSKPVEAPVSIQAEPVTEEPAEDKAAKKDKDKSKATKLVYSDNEISPEEKMAKMPRYAYTPDRKTMMV